MKVSAVVLLILMLVLSHASTNRFDKEIDRSIAAKNSTTATNELKDIRKNINLEGVFALNEGDIKRYRVVEKPDLIISFQNLNGDLYTKLSWQADNVFQRVKTEKIDQKEKLKTYRKVKLNQRGQYNANILEYEGVLFYKDSAQRELELEEIL